MHSDNITCKKIAFVPFFHIQYIVAYQRGLHISHKKATMCPVVRKKSENIDPKHSYKKLFKQMNTFKIMESGKDDQGDVHNNSVFILCFFFFLYTLYC